ncbi:MAG TPA: cation:proton antiporter [Acidimicrobiales bacterium]|jgi:Kef-type K+ transport system membrane component KefB|nr:cation:proton antiporter [Acidimicrobiales bacterium]
MIPALVTNVAVVVVGEPRVFISLVVIAIIAVAAPIIVDLKPSLRIPAVVVEMVLGTVVGPHGFNLISPNVATDVLSFLGLGFLLFVAGLELNPVEIRRHAGTVVTDYVISLVIGIGAAYLIARIEPISHPLLLGFALTSTSLGVIVPILRDARENRTPFGQMTVAHASMGEFGSLILVAVFFSSTDGDPAVRIGLFVAFAILMIFADLVMARALRSNRLFDTARRLRGGSWQLDVRLAMLVLIVFAALADVFGFDAILGAFAAGAIIKVIDRRGIANDQDLVTKIDAVGYGFLIPVFFISAGINLNLRLLVEQPKHFLLIPAFLVAILIARGLPAQRHRAQIGRLRAAALGLLLSTTLTVLVVVVDIATEEHILDQAAASALLAAGLLSELLFPPVARWLLERADQPTESATEQPA